MALWYSVVSINTLGLTPSGVVDLVIFRVSKNLEPCIVRLAKRWINVDFTVYICIYVCIYNALLISCTTCNLILWKSMYDHCPPTARKNQIAMEWHGDYAKLGVNLRVKRWSNFYPFLYTMQSVLGPDCTLHEIKSLRPPLAFANPKVFTHGWPQEFFRSARRRVEPRASGW